MHDTSGAAYSLEQLLRFFRTDIYPPGAVNIPHIPELLSQIASGQNNYSADLSDILSILSDIYSASSSVAGDASDIKGYLSSYLPYLATESTLGDVLGELSILESYLASIDGSLGDVATETTLQSVLSVVGDVATESTLQSVLSALQSGGAGSSNVVNALADLQGLLEASTGQVSHVAVDSLPEISVAVTNQNAYDDTWLKLYLTGRTDGDVAVSPRFSVLGSTAIGNQSLEQFLSVTLGTLVDSSRSSVFGWEQTFDPNYTYITPDGFAAAGHQIFTVWLAEAMRRLINTNMLAANRIDYARRAITENQSLLLTEFREAFDDSQASNTVADATSDTETAIDEENEDAQDELDDLYTPEDNTDYVPNVQLTDIGNQQQLLGLDSQSAGNHSAIITLVHRTRAPGLGGGSSGILPPVEIDLGRQSSLVSGLASFSDFLDYIYAAVFGFLLAVKGLHMWLVCRTASTAAAVGEQPVISLGWNPF